MTTKQLEIIDSIYELATEHFDGCLLIFQAECEDTEGVITEEETSHLYSGGKSMAIGMLEKTRHRMLHSREDEE